MASLPGSWINLGDGWIKPDVYMGTFIRVSHFKKNLVCFYHINSALGGAMPV